MGYLGISCTAAQIFAIEPTLPIIRYYKCDLPAKSLSMQYIYMSIVYINNYQ